MPPNASIHSGRNVHALQLTFAVFVNIVKCELCRLEMSCIVEFAYILLFLGKVPWDLNIISRVPPGQNN